MITVAITGGMGCGKSSACEALSRAGVNAIFSSDAMVRDILDSDRDVFCEIVSLLGREVVSAEGSLDRRKIAEIVFADNVILSQYETIIYKRLIGKITSLKDGISQRTEVADSSDERIICVEIPLLFEKKLEKFFDIRLAVFCSEELRLYRLAQRGMNPQEIKSRDSFQLPPALKAELSDIVLFNESNVDFLERQAAEIVYRLKSHGRRIQRITARR